MEIIDNIPVWGAPVDEGALKQIKTCHFIFGQAAMMADHHKGYRVRSAASSRTRRWSAHQVSAMTSGGAWRRRTDAASSATCCLPARSRSGSKARG